MQYPRIADDVRQEIRTFFDSYRRAFERFDAAAIADHFAFPAHLRADGSKPELFVVRDRRAWVEQLERFLGGYRALDVASARILGIAATELSPSLAHAAVRWRLGDSAGRTLYEFVSGYTLVRVTGALRIAAIAHDETPRYRDAVARVGRSRSRDV
jgi:hypothetical protein